MFNDFEKKIKSYRCLNPANHMTGNDSIHNSYTISTFTKQKNNNFVFLINRE